MVRRSVLGEEYEFKEMKIDIFKLKYYPENPRVHHIIHNLGKNLSQEKIEETMWDDDNTKDLYMDIKQNGLQDPILISDDFKVMEGNTRLCAFRYLYRNCKDSKDKERWRYIQCEMYPEGLDKLGMHYMLGRWHIVQKNPWDAFEKASYIRRLMTEFDKSMKDISTELTIKETDIKKMLWTEGLMVDEKVKNIKLYSHFEQCYQKPEIRDKINTKPKFKKKLVKLITSGNIGKAQNIRKLPKILNMGDEGIEMLEKGIDFDKVYSKALEYDPEDNPILKDMDKFIKKIEKLNTIDFLSEMNRDNEKKEMLSVFFKKVDGLKKLCKKKKLIM